MASKFSKRHYEAIAQALQEAHAHAPDDRSGGAEYGVTTAQQYLEDMLARDNAAFKRGRFRAACVPGANVRARG
jgi:hypothetical protein